MKRILAIILALSMALSLGTAFASETPKYRTATITLNVNSQLVQMLAGGGNEAVDAVISIINKLSIVALNGENGTFELSANLPGGKLFGLNGAMNENGYLITTELLPSYAIQIGAETISKLMQSMTMADDKGEMLDFTALAELVEPYKSGPEVGEFTVNGKTYNEKHLISMDSVALLTLLRALSTMLPAGSLDMSTIPSDEEAAEMDELFTCASYIDKETSMMAFDLAFSEGDVVNQRILCEAYMIDVNTVGFNCYIPQNAEFESWDAAVAALNAGEDLGYSVTAGVSNAVLVDRTTAKIDFTIYNAGQYMFGLNLDGSETGYDMAFSLMSPDMTLFNVSAVIAESDTPAMPADAGERIVVDYETLSAGMSESPELSAALENDLQYGVTTLMVNLIQFAPEEMTVLMNVGREQETDTPTDEAPVGDTTVDEAPVDEAPIDEAPSDDAPAVPAA